MEKVRGVTVLELLVVLAILGTLSLAGATYISSRRPLAVRALMDELEGALVAAQRLGVASGREVRLVGRDGWGPERALQLSVRPARSELAPEEVVFRFQAHETIHRQAGVVVGSGDWWAQATLGMEDLTTVPPFHEPGAVPEAKGPLQDPSWNLFQGPEPEARFVSGASGRFSRGLWIQVVSLMDGKPVAGGPVGLIFVPDQGATIFRFYNPGSRGADGRWRRL